MSEPKTKNASEPINVPPEETNEEDLLATIIMEGTIVSAYVGQTKFDETNKNRFAIESETIPFDKIHAFDSNGVKLTPKWYKEKTGYVNLKSTYDVPVKLANGKISTFEEWINTGLTMGAKVKVKIKQKDGSIYPLAISVLVNGEERNPFDDM